VHDADYRTSWKDWESFVESLTEKIVDKDDTIPELPPKDLVRRLKKRNVTSEAACVDGRLGFQNIPRCPIQP
jgi:Conserved hypothetical protein (DUF2461)